MTYANWFISMIMVLASLTANAQSPVKRKAVLTTMHSITKFRLNTKTNSYDAVIHSSQTFVKIQEAGKKVLLAANNEITVSNPMTRALIIFTGKN